MGAVYNQRSFHLRIENAKLVLYLSETGSGYTTLTGTTNIVALTWTHIAVERVGDTVQFKINGAAGASKTHTTSIHNGTGDWLIGSNYGTSFNPYNGKIDDLKITVGGEIEEEDPVLTISSALDQIFETGALATGIAPIEIIAGDQGLITATNDIRITIPAGLNLTWDTTDTEARIRGEGVDSVSPTVSYEDGGKTLVEQMRFQRKPPCGTSLMPLARLGSIKCVPLHLRVLSTIVSPPGQAPLAVCQETR
ncbi:MAG: LamG domain-containing protein [Lentisphaeria bacterium]|nr:LamG domain-containing protein [Lentisphaeria bacterium]